MEHVMKLFAAVLMLFIVIGVVSCIHSDRYQKQCEAKGGTYIELDDKEMCVELKQVMPSR